MKRRAGFWLLGAAVLAAALIALIAGGRLRIDSNLLSLLPAPERDPVNTAAMARLAALGQGRMVLLITAANADHRRRAAAAAARSLAQSQAFTHVIASADDLLTQGQRQQLQQLVFNHRFHLLAPADAAALPCLATASDCDKAKARAHFLARAQAALYGLGFSGGGRFSDDPLGLSAAYRSAVAAGALAGVRISAGGDFYVQGDQRRYALVFAQSRHSAFNFSAQAAQLAALKKARTAARAVAPGARFLISAVVRHAAAATNRARFEASFIGTGSLIGILMLMLAAFGSIRPFLASLAAIVGGVLTAAVVTGMVFGRVNIITLVFGASLVGVAVDYCLHFFAQRWHTPAPRTALRDVLRPVTLGLTTSVLAYGGMAVAPFPGLRQIATFAATGLIGAWLGMIFLLPGIAGPAPRAGILVHVARAWLARRTPRTRRPRVFFGALAVVFTICAAIVFFALSPDDNVRILYHAPPALAHDDARIAKLLGSPLANRAIIIRGQRPDTVLATEAAIVQALAAGNPPIARVQAITQAYPPAAQQRRNYARLAHTLYARDGPVAHLLAEAGFKPDSIRAHLQAFRARRGHVLAFNRWLASPAATGLRNLWLGRVGGAWATLIRVRQVNDPAALKRIVAAQGNATLIDRVAEISALIGRYRQLATWLLIGAYGLIGLLLCRPFGAQGALVTLAPPMLASVIVAAVFTLAGWPFSLFNLLAMILLLGLGADYGIFLRMAGANHAPTLVAVALSAATTLLSFGLLAFSSTPALHSFGLTLALGLAITFVLATWIGASGDSGEEKHDKEKV